jgi:hypothetical protein
MLLYVGGGMVVTAMAMVVVGRIGVWLYVVAW